MKYAKGSAKKSKTLNIDENILKMILSCGAIGAIDVDVVETVSCSTVVGKVYSS